MILTFFVDEKKKNEMKFKVVCRMRKIGFSAKCIYLDLEQMPMEIYGWQNNSFVAFGILILQFNMHVDNLRFIRCEEMRSSDT